MDANTPEKKIYCKKKAGGIYLKIIIPLMHRMHRINHIFYLYNKKYFF